MLVMGGRLVCFYPVLREDDVENHFPEHPCLKLIVSSEQIPSSRFSRVLLTIVKTVSYTDKIAEAAKIKHQEFKENYVKWTLRPQKSEPGHCALMTAFCLLMIFILLEKE
uniref:Uncharacterized protein n=2 Tax=Populus trichocarpa TaxID=3694 RepID=A0A3N7FLI1_POPTR